jgi:hypothetical protein
MIQAALRGPVPRFYANSIAIGQSPVDVALVMFANGGAIGTVNIAYPTAKQLIDDLQKAITFIETATGEKIRPISDINNDLNSQMSKIDATNT